MSWIDMEKPSACRWTDEENNTHSCPFLDREFDCLIQGHIGNWSWDEQYKDCPLHEVTADKDAVSRKQAIDAINALHDKPNAWLDYAVEAIKDLPSSPTQSRPTGYWMRMSDLNESEDDRYQCSCCGNIVHHRDKVSLYTYNSWCGACGANMNAKNYVAYMQRGGELGWMM